MTEETQKISHPDMVRALAKSGKAIVTGMTYQAMHNLHMAVGISGEVGELHEAYAIARDARIEVQALKTMSLNMEKPGKEQLKKVVELILEEHGDLEFYMVGLYQGTGIMPMEKPTFIHIPQVFNEIVWVAADILDCVNRQAIYEKELEIGRLAERMGRMECCLYSLRSYTGFCREEHTDANIRKLGKRYKDFQYSNQQAIDRADKKVE